MATAPGSASGTAIVFTSTAFPRSSQDLNWECEELRHEIIDMMLYWQKMGVGGFPRGRHRKPQEISESL